VPQRCVVFCVRWICYYVACVVCIVRVLCACVACCVCCVCCVHTCVYSCVRFSASCKFAVHAQTRRTVRFDLGPTSRTGLVLSTQEATNLHNAQTCILCLQKPCCCFCSQIKCMSIVCLYFMRLTPYRTLRFINTHFSQIYNSLLLYSIVLCLLCYYYLCHLLYLTEVSLWLRLSFCNILSLHIHICIFTTF
jgi:hypothetical protein